MKIYLLQLILILYNKIILIHEAAAVFISSLMKFSGIIGLFPSMLTQWK